MARAVVTGATGAQGRAIAQAFRQTGHTVVGLARRDRPDQASAVNIDDDEAVARVLEGADVLVFTPPLDYRAGVRERLAERLARAANRAGVGCVVINTSGAVPDSLDRPVAGVLRRVREIFAASGVPMAVIEPTAYMDNLSEPWVAPTIAGGVLSYPAPRHARISWISHASLGAFAVAAAGHAAPGGRVFEIGGPEALTGDEVAKRLGAALGRPVRYEETPLDAFAAATNAARGAPVGDDLADYYRHLRDQPDALARDGAAAATLEVAPESMAAWAARQAWPQAAA